MRNVVFLILASFLCGIYLNTYFSIDPVGATYGPAPKADELWYVEPGGDGSLPCLASDPCNFAMAYASSASGDIIIFKQGTYHQDDMGWPGNLGYLIWLESKTTHIYGGWDGDPGATTNPTLDPDLYQSILTGGNSTRVINVTGASNTSIISGFLITSGNAEDALNTHCTGGGIVNGACGGGIYIYGSSPTIDNNTFSFNNAVYSDAVLDGAGGAIYANASPSLTITNNWIIGNAANRQFGDGYGGGIHLYDCGENIVVNDNIFQSNFGAQDTYVSRGGAAVIDYVDGATLSRNQFKNNNAFGSIVTLGSAMMSTMSNLTINDNQFLDNSHGYVLALNSSVAFLNRNTLNNPEALYGLYINGGAPRGTTVATNNIIANHLNGNIILLGNETNYAETVFYYTTIAFTSTGTDDRGVVVADYVNASFYHGIVANQYYAFKSSGHEHGLIYLDTNLLYGNTTNFDTFTAGTFEAHYTSGGDPDFINPVFTGNANFHIGPNSAARDIGPGFGGLNTDIDGQVRPNPSHDLMNAADLGADEFWGWFLPILMK